MAIRPAPRLVEALLDVDRMIIFNPLIDQLVRRRQVTRAENARDRRRTNVRLTSADTLLVTS
jgi:hypothetical protein